MPPLPRPPLLTRLTRAALAALLLAALFPRAREIGVGVGHLRAAAVVASRGWARATVEEGLDPALLANLVEVGALAAHLAAALALSLTLERVHAPAAGLFALALWGALPIACLHGSLWGPENLGLAAGLWAGLTADHWVSSGRRRWFTAGLAALALCAATGPIGALFALALLLAPPREGSPRLAVALAGCLVALGVGYLLETPPPGGLPGPRIGIGDAFGLPALAVATFGIASRLLRLGSSQRRARLDRFAVGTPPRRELVLALLAAAAAAQLLVPESSLLLWAPALAAAGSAFFVQMSRPLLGLRAGLGPVIIAVGLVVIPGLAGFEHLRQEVRRAERP